MTTEEDFWQSRQFLLESEMWKTEQKKGLLSSSLSDLKATADPMDFSGSGDTKLTLDAVKIHQIFLEYPSVKRAYQDNVPNRMDENKFWGNFVASKYFHRSRGTVSGLQSGDDFFSKYEKEEGVGRLVLIDRGWKGCWEYDA
jgi:transcription initiation factor TFIIH subunit 1